jgi:membrane protease YdiL (CAAX protease family)
MLIGVVFLVPVTEEMLYRGLIFRELLHTSKAAAYLVSMAAFAAIHVLGYIGSYDIGRLVLCFIQYLPAGLCLAWAYAKSDSLFAPVLIRALINAYTVSKLR